VLKGLNLDILEGEVMGLLGTNGAGKTTMMEIIATLLLPSSGQATVCGYDVVREARQARQLLNYCPSTSGDFYPRLTGVQNLEFFALLNNLSPREAKRRILSTLALVGLDSGNPSHFQRYSEGMKQKLTIARALLTDPKVLLLDEPTRGLDPVSQGEIRRFLREHVAGHMGKTVLLVTHSLSEVEQVCDRMAILHGGKIVGVGKPQDVKAAWGGQDLTAAFERAVGATPCR